MHYVCHFNTNSFVVKLDYGLEGIGLVGLICKMNPAYLIRG
jgi:hypothetical protein